MIGYPLIHRELLGLLRTRRCLCMLAGTAIGFTLLIIARWPSDGRADLAGATSREMFRVFAYALTAAVTLLVPVFPATSFVVEKRGGTLALLLNSPLHPVSIYLGKLIASLGFVMLVLVVTLPATAACFALGGVSLRDELVPLFGVLLLASVQFATWALLVSVLSATSDSAVRATFGGVVVQSVLVLVPHYFLQGGESRFARLAAIIRHVSPVPAVMDIIGHGDLGGQGLVDVVDHVQRYLWTAPLLSLAFAACAVSRLNWSLFDRARSQGRITDDQATLVRGVRRLVFLVDPQRRKAGIGPLTNPVMIKEFRSRQFGRLHWLLRLVSACALISLALAFAATLGSEEWGVETIGSILVMMQVALIVLFAPALAAGLISSERESGGWDLLRTTPLSPGKIVRGKLLSVLWTLLLVLMSTLPGYGVMIWIKPVLREQILQVLVCLSLGALFAMLLSATVSSFFNRTAAATVTSYSLLLALWAGTLLVWLGRDAPFGYSTVQAALALNPMAAALNVIGTRGFETYRLLPLNWWLTGGGTALLLAVLLVRTRRLTQPD